MFEFLSKGAIAKDHPDLKGFRDDPCLTRLSATDDPKVYTHALRLDSAVDVNALPFTNYTYAPYFKFFFFPHLPKRGTKELFDGVICVVRTFSVYLLHCFISLRPLHLMEEIAFQLIIPASRRKLSPKAGFKNDFS